MGRAAISCVPRARRYRSGPPAGSGRPGLAPAAVLERAATRVATRLADLEARVDAGDDQAWALYLDAVRALAALAPLLDPGPGRLLTTAEMAARLGISPKTLRKRRAMGLARPALQHGRLLRWRADQVPGSPVVPRRPLGSRPRGDGRP